MVKNFGAALGLRDFAAVLAFITGVITLVIALRACRPVDRCEEIVQRAKGWVSKIEITSSDKNVRNVIWIQGKVDFRATATQTQSGPAVHLLLEENQVELIPLVRVMSGKNSTPWAVQQKPVIQADGTFEDWVVLAGDNASQYDIVVLAVGKGCVTDDELKELPSYIGASNHLLAKPSN